MEEDKKTRSAELPNLVKSDINAIEQQDINDFFYFWTRLKESIFDKRR